MTDPQRERFEEILGCITYYLSTGGLFNPELANHNAVRDLLIDCREVLTRAVPLSALVPLTDEQIDVLWEKAGKEWGEATTYHPEQSLIFARAIEAAHGIK
jgi:hypothetical protein